MPDTVVSDASVAGEDFYLEDDPRGLTLRYRSEPAGNGGLRLDFLDGSLERRLGGGRKSPLARALGLHRRPAQHVLDTTCGLGRDSALLAALGCDVVAIERHPQLFALLEDARNRAASSTPPPVWLDQWAWLVNADARKWLMQQDIPGFDIIYIDPMFDAPRRKARPQKSLAWLGDLVGVDTDAGALLDVARSRALRRTVVKQHTRSQPLATPDRQVRGKAVRFDIYLTPQDESERIE